MFLSEEGITNLNNSISRSFNTKSASEIAKLIYNDYIKTDKEFDVEDTEGNLKLVIPNWKPFKTLNWLAGTKAINKNENADFFFFESLNKIKGPKFNFKSLSTLLNQTPVFTIEFSTQNISDGKSRDVSTAAYNIDSFSFPKHNDSIDATASGMYAQTWILHDPLRKKFVISKQTFSDAVNEEGNKTFSTNQETNSSPLQYIRMPGGVNSFPSKISVSKSIDNDTTKAGEINTDRKSISYIADREAKDELECSSLISTISSKRIFKINQLNSYKIIFPDIPGTHLIQLGSVVKFNKPHLSNDQDRYNKKLGRFDDRFLSGNYLVMRMRHCIFVSPEKSELQYTISIEGAKTKFEEQISSKTL